MNDVRVAVGRFFVPTRSRKTGAVRGVTVSRTESNCQCCWEEWMREEYALQAMYDRVDANKGSDSLPGARDSVRGCSLYAPARFITSLADGLGECDVADEAR